MGSFVCLHCRLAEGAVLTDSRRFVVCRLICGCLLIEAARRDRARREFFSRYAHHGIIHAAEKVIDPRGNHSDVLGVACWIQRLWGVISGHPRADFSWPKGGFFR